MFVDLLLSKHNHNSAAVGRFLLVLGAAFEERKLRTATLQRWWVAGFSLRDKSISIDGIERQTADNRDLYFMVRLN